MTNEQLIYWIEGYLSDKWSIEACAIRSKIKEVREASTPELVPLSYTSPTSPWANTGAETAQWVGTDV